MSKNKIIEETVETIIDHLYETSHHYMFELGKYGESDNKFIKDQEEIVKLVIKELNNRIK
tara:strand:+ start:440 stop:619 length:180 start_codon:yes stop_codon:yes gene_type:complete